MATITFDDEEYEDQETVSKIPLSEIETSVKTCLEKQV